MSIQRWLFGEKKVTRRPAQLQARKPAEQGPTNRYKLQQNIVKAEPAAPLVRRMRPDELNTVNHSIDVRPNATHHVEMKTSAVDRSKGFLLATLPLFAGFALGVLLISIFFFDVPLFSLTALVIYWLSFVGTWLISYVYTLAVSAEGIAMFEARRKWHVIEREQTERWNYYKSKGQ